MSLFTPKRILLSAIALFAAVTVCLFGCGGGVGGGGNDDGDVTYTVRVESAGTGASKNSAYAAGAKVAISAGEAPAGQKFTNWTTTDEDVIFADANKTATTFIMPAKNVTVKANFEQIPDGGGGEDDSITTPTPQYYTVTVLGDGTGMTGDGDYATGDTVAVTAGTPPAGQAFKKWTTTDAAVTFADANRAATTFIMPAKPVTVTAEFESVSTTTPTYTVTVSGGTGGGSYAVGATVSITAGTAPTGQVFKNWTTSSNGVTFANANSATTTFKMPSNAVTVTAEFGEAPKYTVTVSSKWAGAAGSGSYSAGTTVSINAGTAPSGQIFTNWTTSSSGVTFANANSATTTFKMPANAVTVTANFVTGFYDTRDNKFYKTVTIGSQTWMAENLNYQPSTGNSWCYANRADSCIKYGRLYDWATAMDIEPLFNEMLWGGSDVKHQGVCPVGWHLPSRAEWNTLADYAGGSSTAGTKLKSKSGWYTNVYNTNDFYFSALPGGRRNTYDGGSFTNSGYDGYWWTATEDDGRYAYNRSMNYFYVNVYEYDYVKAYGVSVRCVGD